MTDDKGLALQAYYTYSELAKAMSISRRRVERLCRNEGILTHRVGNRHVVWLSDIEEHLPAMFRSLMTCMRLRAMQTFLQTMGEGRAVATHAKGVKAEFERNERHNPS